MSGLNLFAPPTFPAGALVVANAELRDLLLNDAEDYDILDADAGDLDADAAATGAEDPSAKDSNTNLVLSSAALDKSFDLVNFDALWYAAIDDWKALQYIHYAQGLLQSKPKPLKQSDHAILEELSTVYDLLIEVLGIKGINDKDPMKFKTMHNFRSFMTLAGSSEKYTLSKSSEALIQFQEAIKLVEEADIIAPLNGELAVLNHETFGRCLLSIQRCIEWIGKLTTDDNDSEYNLKYALSLIRGPDTIHCEADQELKGLLSKAQIALENMA